MADLLGKLFDVVTTLPWFKLGKLGKLRKALDAIREALKRIEALKGALRAAQQAVEAAGKKLTGAIAGRDVVRKSVQEKLAKLPTDDDVFAKAKNHYKSELGLSDGDAADKALEAVKKNKAARDALESKLTKADDKVREAEEDVRKAQDGARNAEIELATAQGIAKTLLEGLAEFLLPMDAIKSLASLLGVKLVSAALPDGRGSLEGALLTSDGAASEGMLVVLARGGLPVDAAITDAAGWFGFTGLEFGDYQLVADAVPIHCQWVRVASETVSATLGANAGFPAVITIADDGAPVADATVLVVRVSDAGVEDVWMSATDFSGACCLHVMDVGERYVVLAYTEYEHGFTLLPPRDIVAFEAPLEAEFALPTASITGTVRDAASRQPLTDVQVDVYATVNGKPAVRLMDRSGARVTTDHLGVYQVHHLTPGRYVAVCGKPGYAHVHQNVTAEPDRVSRLDDLELTEVAEAGALLGHIEDLRGVPSSAYVVLSDAGGLPVGRHTFSDEAGAFRFDAVSPGLYKLAAEGAIAGTFAEQSVTVHGRCAEEVTVRLRDRFRPD